MNSMIVMKLVYFMESYLHCLGVYSALQREQIKATANKDEGDKYICLRSRRMFH